MDGPIDAALVRLLAAVERYLVRHRLAARRFGVLVCNDSALVLELRKGRNVGRALERRIWEFIRGPVPPEVERLRAQAIAVAARKRKASANRPRRSSHRVRRRRPGPTAGETEGSAPRSSRASAKGVLSA